MVENRSFAKREEIYRWFSVLDSAQRAEFLCGLLDLCVPIELRFFGSCLEDLARKDYHSLRDAEIKANNPADLANLTNITDEVVRSKLLVSLALLGSDNRVAAGVLFRTLTHIDTIINNYGLRLNDGRTGEQFLLLFTMASNHPAFSFHQKRVLRQELTQIQEILLQVMDEGAGGVVSTGAPSSARATFSSYVTAFGSCQAGCPCCKPEVMGGKTDEGAEVTPSSPSPIAGKSGKEHVERIELRGVTAKADACVEKCVLEASWSDSSSSTVSKSLQEVQEFFSQVSQLFPEERLENLQPLMPGVDSTQELDLRCFASLPPHVLKHDKVRLFFSTSSAPPLANSTNVGCLLQFRGARPVCGVASIRPVLGLHTPLTPGCPACLPHLQPHTTVLPIMPSAAGEGGPHAHPVAPPQPQPRPSQPCPEQSGILDWLRKLRLHKYYPVFKQLTMEEFLALTEEDLNKYDLTQGAKKKLKTQLELQKEKLEKRYTLSQFPIACGGGVARVTPSSHIHTATHTHPGCSSAELRVEVENSAAMLLPLDSGSSSGYSSAPSSPMTPLSRDLSFDRVKRAEACGLDPGAEKERTCFLLNPAPSGPARPTAQVLPVQNDPNFCLPPPSLSFLPSGRIISAPRKPRPPPQGTEERPKPAAVRLENLFPALSLDSSPAHQEAPGPRGPFSGGVLYSPARPPGVPVAATPGNTYSVGATPSATPTPASTEGSRPPSASLCVCSSCGCGGGCGSYGTLPSSYVPHFSGTSVFTLGPLLHFSSSPFSYPLVAPPLYGSQQGLVLPPVQGFVGGGVYQPLGMLGNGSAALKKGGNASCYNCGVSGHRAQDCKQPAMDSAQQGSFRLKYSPQSDSQDSGD